MVGVTDPKTGKFVKGNKAGGRKSRPAEERYLERFKACVSIEDVDEIINKAVQGAKRGDPADRKFIFDYLVGPPVQKNILDANVNAEIVLKTIKGVSVDSL